MDKKRRFLYEEDQLLAIDTDKNIYKPVILENNSGIYPDIFTVNYNTGAWVPVDAGFSYLWGENKRTISSSELRLVTGKRKVYEYQEKVFDVIECEKDDPAAFFVADKYPYKHVFKGFRTFQGSELVVE